MLTEFCDSLLSWPCVNLGRLSHQKTFNKNTFCLLDIAVDTFFCDSILPLVLGDVLGTALRRSGGYIVCRPQFTPRTGNDRYMSGKNAPLHVLPLFPV